MFSCTSTLSASSTEEGSFSIRNLKGILVVDFEDVFSLPNCFRCHKPHRQVYQYIINIVQKFVDLRSNLIHPSSSPASTWNDADLNFTIEINRVLVFLPVYHCSSYLYRKSPQHSARTLGNHHSSRSLSYRPGMSSQHSSV
ncbi:hypothetical protein RRG08_032103 [Elysia crispata]|uniref:Uncharacterized protein n=1 Tax=Elysia crispata TaxID=231223 RepID=A0AAE1DFE4_9GAST|nr:hypothetical protein RRG08_032103 [Elysia crispata]